MLQKFANNAYTTLNASITDVATAVGVTDGSVFPALAAGEFFYATLINASANIEILKVTARNGNNLTVERGQDGTNARAWDITTDTTIRIEQRPTAGGLRDLLKGATSNDFLP